MHLSLAPIAINSRGWARIAYDSGGTRKCAAYVPQEAVTLLQPGADIDFDAAARYASVSREIALSRRFFDLLAARVARDRRHPQPVPKDASEYDAEEAERTRLERLGVTPSSTFLNIGVDNQLTWPRHEELVAFDQYRLVLMPKTNEFVQSISIDLNSNRLSIEQAQTVINRFLSMLSWCDDQFAVVEGGWAGSPVPLPLARRNLAFTSTHQWAFARSMPASEEVRRALALYREARNAEQNFLVSYAVLNYYKIIELRHVGWKAGTKWIADNLSAVLDDPRDQHSIPTFLAACGADSPEKYIYAACRVAVAHASLDRVSDPDEAAELRRLENAADVMRRLARRFIAVDLGVPDDPFAP
ncbi:hypothetical protein E2493_09800 [Sphingomonas parva]|uniref:Uncharacterized protein n=1 Tax=Sphingomonas parva TaxID=2555898 RepID=A0A4Y8ZUJ5_9SPHN|nr:hypothetical protein E2493_09800 [Sphingomonas parva]